MPVEQALGAIEECGAPMVSIAGGEPLVHPRDRRDGRRAVKRKKFVFLCTNALLLTKKLDKFTPSPYFAWVVHLDGLRERHDEFVEREGTFDEAVAAIKEAKRRGFRVNTNTTFFNTDTPKTVRDVLDFLNDELEVDEMHDLARPTPTRRRPTRSTSSASTRRASCSARRSPTATASAGG